MWLFTTSGFYSVVQKEGAIQVRARRRSDLENLHLVADFELHVGAPGEAARRWPIQEGGVTDYAYRIRMDSEEWLQLADLLARRVDYPNFKTAVAETTGQRDKLPMLHRIWRELADYQESLELDLQRRRR